MQSLGEWIIFLSVALQAFWEDQSILFPPSSFEVMVLFILIGNRHWWVKEQGKKVVDICLRSQVSRIWTFIFKNFYERGFFYLSVSLKYLSTEVLGPAVHYSPSSELMRSESTTHIRWDPEEMVLCWQVWVLWSIWASKRWHRGTAVPAQWYLLWPADKRCKQTFVSTDIEFSEGRKNLF